MDIFIAFHGDSITGSQKEAKRIFELLRDKSKSDGSLLKIFFYPETGHGIAFGKTPDICSESTIFLLVANENVGMNENGKIEELRNGEKRRLYEEIEAFKESKKYRMTKKSTARVITCGKLTLQDAEKLHYLFGGTLHFEYNTIVKAPSDFIKELSKILDDDIKENSVDKKANNIKNSTLIGNKLLYNTKWEEFDNSNTIIYLKHRKDVYPRTTQLICSAKRIVILCQKTSSLLLGYRNDPNEQDCYYSIINWLNMQDNKSDFIHIFSEQKTKNEYKSNPSEYFSFKEARDNLEKILLRKDGPRIYLRKLKKITPCVVADNNLLISLTMGSNTHFLALQGKVIKLEDVQSITTLLTTDGEAWTSNFDSDYQTKLNNFYEDF